MALKSPEQSPVNEHKGKKEERNRKNVQHLPFFFSMAIEGVAVFCFLTVHIFHHAVLR